MEFHSLKVQQSCFSGELSSVLWLLQTDSIGLSLSVFLVAILTLDLYIGYKKVYVTSKAARKSSFVSWSFLFASLKVKTNQWLLK